MKEIHLMLWGLAHREICELLDQLPHEADWICLGNLPQEMGRVWLLTADQLQDCGCRNCELHASLRFWVDSRRKAEIELERLGMDLAKVRGGWY